jgi:hypothetical protein|tara:strand:- start:673 stop:1047 length:375 start_codon:yes stop_codon:yes gene_type:complete
MFDKLKKKLSNLTKKSGAKSATSKKKSPLEIANENNEPYVEVLGLDMDIDNLEQGSFELEWNDKFVSNLLRAGFTGKKDADIVDQWFQTICKNIAMESYEQDQADPDKRKNNKKDLGDGYTEVR